MPFTENQAVFFNTAEFATAGLYGPSVGQPYTVNGIFDNADTEIQVGLAGLEANAPRFMCRVADMPNPKNGETLTLNGITYTVQAKQQDGTGVQVVILKEP